MRLDEGMRGWRGGQLGLGGCCFGVDWEVWVSFLVLDFGGMVSFFFFLLSLFLWWFRVGAEVSRLQ